MALTQRDFRVGDAGHARQIRWDELTPEERVVYSLCHTYWEFRIPFAKAMAGVRCFDSGGQKSALEQEIAEYARSLVSAHRGGLLAMDRRFFAAVFAADTSRTFTEEELIGFGAPTAKELAALGIDRL